MPSPRDTTVPLGRKLIERRYIRFTVQLPVTVSTNPVPPHWVPLHFKGETIEIGRGGTSVRFAFDITRFLYRAKSVRLQLGHSELVESHQAINARVAWTDGSRAGFEFTKVLRTTSESYGSLDAAAKGAYTE